MVRALPGIGAALAKWVTVAFAAVVRKEGKALLSEAIGGC